MNMNIKIVTLALVSFLMLATAACNDANTADNTTDPNNPNPSTPMANNNETPNSPTVSDPTAVKDDAQSELRQKQLNADIRAREERNNAMGDRNMRDDSDLASEVRSKLEANIPGGILTIEAKDAVVNVSGTVPAQDQLGKIDKLAMEIKGVKSVNVKASVKSITN